MPSKNLNSNPEQNEEWEDLVQSVQEAAGDVEFGADKVRLQLVTREAIENTIEQKANEDLSKQIEKDLMESAEEVFKSEALDEWLNRDGAITTFAHILNKKKKVILRNKSINARNAKILVGLESAELSFKNLDFNQVAEAEKYGVAMALARPGGNNIPDINEKALSDMERYLKTNVKKEAA